MAFEKTQRGNPHQLTINQHVLSCAHIKRFSRDGVVEVSLVSPQRRTFRAKPEDPVFCAKRQWDQKTESLTMKRIEDAFLCELDAIDSSGQVSANTAISEYFVLWDWRASVAWREHEDPVIRGVTPPSLTKDQREQAEKNGVITMRPDGTMSSRFFVGTSLIVALDRQRTLVERFEWDVVEVDSELHVGDTPIGPFIPIDPRRCLLPLGTDVADVSALNSELVARSQRWHFRAPV